MQQTRRAPTPPRTFNGYLLEYMHTNGMTQQSELAEHLDVEPSTLGRWVNRTTQPQLDNLRKVSERIGVRLGDLMIAVGMATEDEVGVKRGVAQVLPTEIREIVVLLEKLPEQYQKILLHGVREARRFFLAMYEAPREPAMRKRQRAG